MEGAIEALEKLFALEGVKGLCLLDEKRRVIGQKTVPHITYDFSSAPWINRLNPPENFEEVELYFEQDRLFLRRLGGGLLIVWLDPAASLAMVKLQTDLLANEEAAAPSRSGLSRFFGKDRD